MGQYWKILVAAGLNEIFFSDFFWNKLIWLKWVFKNGTLLKILVAAGFNKKIFLQNCLDELSKVITKDQRDEIKGPLA